MEQINFEKIHAFGNRKSTPTHERADLVQQFVDELNKTRGPYKEVTFGQINGKTSHIDLENMRWFLKECKGAKNFGAFFWWSLKK